MGIVLGAKKSRSVTGILARSALGRGALKCGDTERAGGPSFPLRSPAVGVLPQRGAGRSRTRGLLRRCAPW